VCRGHPVQGYNTCWLTGLWSTPARREDIVLEVVWHWGSDSSVVNDPLGEAVCTPLHADLPSVWGSVDIGCMFSPHFMGELLKWRL